MFEDINRVAESIKKGESKPVYLIVGDDEYIITRIRKKLVSLLFPEEDGGFNLESISEEGPDVKSHIIQAFRTISLFKERKIITANLPPKRGVGSGKGTLLEDFLASDLTEKTKNILILSSYAGIDKRGKLYKRIKEIGEVIELPAIKDRKKWTPEIDRNIFRLMNNEAKETGKTIKREAYLELLERTGNDLRAAFCELDKICLYLEDRNQITKKDVELLVEETPQMAFYELGDAIGKRNPQKIMKILHNFLNSAKSPSYILQLMFDCFRHLKSIKEVLRLPEIGDYKPGMDYRTFTFSFLSPLLEKRKNNRIRNGFLLELLNWKPYRIYMVFQHADNFKEDELDNCIFEIAEIDRKIKSTSVSAEDMIYNLASLIV